MAQQTTSPEVTTSALVPTEGWTRWLPLSGTASAIAFAVGTLTIGDFPDDSTSSSALVRYYVSHHASVARGGQILAVAAVLGGLFAAALVLRSRRSPVAATVIAIGGAATLAHAEWSAASYSMVGHIATEKAVGPQVLQAWHLAGAQFGAGSALAVLMIGVALAALTVRAVPGWLAWPGLVLGLVQLTPTLWGFWATLLLVLWTMVAGVVLTFRPLDTDSSR